MAKIGILLITTFALYAVAAPAENANERTSTMKQRLPKMCEDVLAKISKVQVFDTNERRELAVHANDFASKLEDAVHHLFKIIIRTDEKDSHRMIPQVGIRLSDIIHEVRQAILVQPTLIKDTLEDKVRKLETEAKRLLEVVEYFEGNGDSGNAKHDVKDVIDKIMNALNELQRFDDTHHLPSDKLHGITLDECNQILKELNETIDGIKIFDTKTAHYLFREGYGISNFISHIIRHLDRESYHFDSNLKTTVDAIAKQLRGVRVALDGVLEGHKYSDPNEAVKALKEGIKESVQGYAQPLIALLKQSKSGNKYVEGNETFQNLVQMVVYDCKVTTRCLQAKMVQIAGGHPF